MNSIFQSPEWEKFKLATGYSKSFRVDDILVLKKDLPLKRSMLYSPMLSEAQLVESDSGESSRTEVRDLKVESSLDKVGKIAKEENAIFYRLEFDVPESYKLEAERYKLIKSFEEMQPEHTLILDLSKGGDTLLSEMKQKGRYNIKIAEKNNISVRKTRNLDSFYRLYADTGKRHRISFRSREYFQNLLDILEPKGYCELFEAFVPEADSKELEVGGLEIPAAEEHLTPHTPHPTNPILAAAICTFYKGKAIYMFGASSDEYKNLMAPYKLQWEMIKDAFGRGCTSYDFFGIAPDDNPCHPWAGVTRFKKQFGGEEISTHGSYDKIYKPFEYKLFKLAERLRRH